MNRHAAEVLEAIDAEDERQKEALRKYYERERPVYHVTGKTFLAFFGGAALALGAIALFVWYANEALKRIGL